MTLAIQYESIGGQHLDRVMSLPSASPFLVLLLNHDLLELESILADGRAKSTLGFMEGFANI